MIIHKPATVESIPLDRNIEIRPSISYRFETPAAWCQPIRTDSLRSRFINDRILTAPRMTEEFPYYIEFRHVYKTFDRPV